MVMCNMSKKDSWCPLLASTYMCTHVYAYPHANMNKHMNTHTHIYTSIDKIGRLNDTICVL